MSMARYTPLTAALAVLAGTREPNRIVGHFDELEAEAASRYYVRCWSRGLAGNSDEPGLESLKLASVAGAGSEGFNFCGCGVKLRFDHI